MASGHVNRSEAKALVASNLAERGIDAARLCSLEVTSMTQSGHWVASASIMRSAAFRS